MPEFRIEIVIDPTRAKQGVQQVERALDRTNTSVQRGAQQTERALNRTSTSARLSALRVERALNRTNTTATLGAQQTERSLNRTSASATLNAQRVERSLNRTNTTAKLGAQQTERALNRTSTSARLSALRVERALGRTNASARQGALQTKRALDRTSTSANLAALRVKRALDRTNTSARLGALQVERAFKRTELASRRVERSLDRVGDRAGRVRRLLASTFALVGVAVAVRQVAQLSDSFIDLQNRVRIAADSIGGDLGGTLDDLTAVAVRTRAPVLALAGVFQRGSIAADQLNATQEELIRLVEIAGKAVAIQGGGLETARGALLQLSQTLGQTVVRGEEFNSILEGAFPIALAAARGIERVGWIGRHIA